MAAGVVWAGGVCWGCCGGLSTRGGEGVCSGGTDRRLLDVEVDLLELVLKSAVPALKAHVDAVLLSKMAG